MAIFDFESGQWASPRCLIYLCLQDSLIVGPGEYFVFTCVSVEQIELVLAVVVLQRGIVGIKYVHIENRAVGF